MQPTTRRNLVCPFCSKRELKITLPCKADTEKPTPAYRCYACNVRIVVTNPSYLPQKIRVRYEEVVRTQSIGKQ